MKRLVFVLLVVAATAVTAARRRRDTAPASLSRFLQAGRRLPGSQRRRRDRFRRRADRAAGAAVVGRARRGRRHRRAPRLRDVGDEPAGRRSRRGFQPGRAAPTIFVGAKSLAGSGVTLDAIGGAGLKAGDGAGRRVLARAARPAVAVLGGDDDGLDVGGGDARRPPAVRLGSEGADHRQDRRRCEAVPRREGRRPRPPASHRGLRRAAQRRRRRRSRRRRRCRWPTAATS